MKLESKKKSREEKDLRGRSIRLGDVALQTHVTILDGWNRDASTGKIRDLITHEDPSKWSLVKFEIDSAGKEFCYSIASIDFKDPELQEEYDLKSVGNRLIDSVEADDLPLLKKLIAKVDEHCHWRHEQRCYS